MPVIVNTTNNSIGTPGGEHDDLLPGANEVSSELVAFLRGVPYYQALLAKGILAVEGDAAEAPAPAGDELPLSLKGRPMAEVEELIKRADSRERLLKWLSTDGRKATRSLLEARASELEVAHGLAVRPSDPIS